MAARRKRRGRRRNRGRFGFLYKLLSALLIIAALVLGCMVFFRVNTVVVDGASRYSREEIIAAAKVNQGDNLFRLNTVQMRMEVVRALPYLDEVSIRRRLPDTLLIQVTESEAVAYLKSDDGNWLLDTRGKLLEQGDDSRIGALPEVIGLTPVAPEVGTQLVVTGEEQGRLDSLLLLLGAIRDREMTGSLTGFLDLRAGNKIRFGYGPELTIVFPMSGDFTALTNALRGTLWKMDEEMVPRKGTLDLTYSNEARLVPQRWMPTDFKEETPPTAPPAETETPVKEEKGAGA